MITRGVHSGQRRHACDFTNLHHVQEGLINKALTAIYKTQSSGLMVQTHDPVKKLAVLTRFCDVLDSQISRSPSWTGLFSRRTGGTALYHVFAGTYENWYKLAQLMGHTMFRFRLVLEVNWFIISRKMARNDHSWSISTICNIHLPSHKTACKVTQATKEGKCNLQRDFYSHKSTIAGKTKKKRRKYGFWSQWCQIWWLPL